MSRVEVIGVRGRLDAALRFLQARGVLELRAAVKGAAAPAPPAPAAARDAEATLVDALRRIEALSARLPQAHGAAAGDPLPAPGTEAFAAALAGIERELDELEKRRAGLAREREAISRLAHLVVALAPVGATLDPAVEPVAFALLLRSDIVLARLLEADVRALTRGACEVKARQLDAETTGVVVVVPRAHADAIARLLSDAGVEDVPLPPAYVAKRLPAVLLLLATRERAIPGELARTDAALAAAAARAAASLEAARAEVTATLERTRAAGACAETHFTYVISGYVPEERVADLRAAAAAELGDEVAVLARAPSREEWHDVPVVLRSSALVRPFHRLLALVELPRYGSTDPTPWIAAFFPLFFGLVLGDVAFGVVGALAAGLVWRAGWGGELGRDLAQVALLCSASAAAFGILFGEALGGVGGQLGMHPILLERRSAFMTFLALTLALGALHVGVATALGVRSAARARRRREVVARAAKLLLLAAVCGAACAVGRVLPRAALVPFLGVAAVFLGVAIAAEGPLAILDLVMAVGNVLSYSRLMALGLASVMLAEVANRVATTLEPAAAGLALGVLLHAVNFTVGLVSPAIAALRLHYVEFFEKFYDEGGAPYRPLALVA